MKLKLIPLFSVTLFAAFLAPLTTNAADFQDAVKKPIDRSITIRRQTQDVEDRWTAEQRELEAEYDRLVNRRDELSEKRQRLRKRAAVLKTTLNAQTNQLREISRITAELDPFLEETYQRIAGHIAGDTPFLMDERENRLHHLRRTLDDPLVSTGEKFRKIMETISVEAGYGNTVEIYREKILFNDREILADLFRLGRISLFFKTLDGKTVGRWDPAHETWRPLPETHKRPIQDAMDMAAKHRSVEVVTLPVGRISSP